MNAINTGTLFDDYTIWRNDRPESLNRQWSSLAGRWVTDETTDARLEASNAPYASWAVALRNGVRARHFKYEITVVGTGGVDRVGPAFGIVDYNNLFFVHGYGSTVYLQQVKAGKSEAEIIGFMTSRYGDWVLLKPPLKPTTALLWFGPLILVLIGGVMVFRYVRQRPETAIAKPLSAAEEKRLKKILAGKDHLKDNKS